MLSIKGIQSAYPNTLKQRAYPNTLDLVKLGLGVVISNAMGRQLMPRMDIKPDAVRNITTTPLWVSAIPRAVGLKNIPLGARELSRVHPSLSDRVAGTPTEKGEAEPQTVSLSLLQQTLEKKIQELSQWSKPEESEAFYLSQLLGVLNVGAFDALPNIDPITYFDCHTLNEFLAYCKALKPDEKLDVWDTLEASIKAHVTNDNYTCPQYFSKVIMALNLAIAKKSQENEVSKAFQEACNQKYEGQKYTDTNKPDTGFCDPENQAFGNVFVSICEVNGMRKNRRGQGNQEDQYHVGYLEIDQASAPSELKAILAECEAKAQQQDVGRSGSAATLTHLSATGMITVASVGDAPALFLAKHKDTGALTMVPLTRDHEPSHFYEKSRIQKNGGSIYFDGWFFRVNCIGLNLTRAIGDFKGKETPSKMVISNEPDVVQFDARSYLQGEYEVCVLTACDGILDHGKATRQNYAELFGLKNHGEARNFSQRCVSYALHCGSRDNITATAAEFSSLPDKGVLLGVFDGHGGKQTSKVCKDTVAARCAGI